MFGVVQVVGIGWAVNLPVAMRKLSEIVSQYSNAIGDRSEPNRRRARCSR